MPRQPRGRGRAPPGADASCGSPVRLQLCQQLLVFPPGTGSVLRECPAHDPFWIDQNVGPIGEELVLDERSVLATHLALEVAQQVNRNALLGLELPEGGN